MTEPRVTPGALRDLLSRAERIEQELADLLPALRRDSADGGELAGVAAEQAAEARQQIHSACARLDAVKAILVVAQRPGSENPADANVLSPIRQGRPHEKEPVLDSESAGSRRAA